MGKPRPADVYEKCMMCNGNGWVQPDPKKSPRTCSTCGGAGKFKV